MTSKGLYIHLPFCEHLCAYCDFTKVLYDKKLSSDYVKALGKDLASLDNHDFTSVYLGGGTPTALSEEELGYLLLCLKPFIKEGISFTCEGNVENCSKEKIRMLAEGGVNRVSLGVQTFNEGLLKTIDRHHDKKMVEEVLKNLHEAGIHDINVDLIYGLPGETMDDLKEDLKEFLSLPVTHISTYALSVNDHTFFKARGYEEQDDDTVREMYDLIVETLKEHGFYRYEVSNFAKPGYESKHNLVYWHNEEYAGIGAGASGYEHGIRYENTHSISSYIAGTRHISEEVLTPEDIDFYKVMLGLRLEEGIQGLPEAYQGNLQECLELGLLEKKGETIRVKEENLFILDYILQKLLF